MGLSSFIRLGALPLAALTTTASAVPIIISDAGYWLDTVGTNTIGTAGGGAAGGVVTALFDAFTSPISLKFRHCPPEFPLSISHLRWFLGFGF